jgi:hypothetical protein
MDVNQINAYLSRAREIIGDRSQAETEYEVYKKAGQQPGLDHHVLSFVFRLRNRFAVSSLQS